MHHFLVSRAGKKNWSRGVVGYVIRGGRADDVEAIVDLGKRFGLQMRPESSWGQRDAISLVIERAGGDLCGAFIAWRLADEMEVHDIVVDDPERRSGLGRQLMERALEVARVWGCRAILLEVGSRNQEARNFYQRLGFQQVGERKNYYANGDSALLLRQEL
ncbi:MAG: GNAT family N-acetyltransferase [Polyangiaceae bacterium]|nr:GNAT family N-acetyltransferase [Polyangiaceae bacterium]